MVKLAVPLMVLVLCSFVISGCMIVASPALGVIYTDLKYGDTATTATSASKEGKACVQSILGWVAQGDASVEAAKKNGGIKEVSSVDHTAKSILGIVGEWCTVVRGT
jgi:TRL-like protein family